MIDTSFFIGLIVGILLTRDNNPLIKARNINVLSWIKKNSHSDFVDLDEKRKNKITKLN